MDAGMSSLLRSGNEVAAACHAGIYEILHSGHRLRHQQATGTVATCDDRLGWLSERFKTFFDCAAFAVEHIEITARKYIARKCDRVALSCVAHPLGAPGVAQDLHAPSASAAHTQRTTAG